MGDTNSIAPKKKKFLIPSLNDVDHVKDVEVDSTDVFKKRSKTSDPPVVEKTTNILSPYFSTGAKDFVPASNIPKPIPAIPSSNNNNFNSSTITYNVNNNNSNTKNNINNNNINNNNNNNNNNNTTSFSQAFAFVRSDPLFETSKINDQIDLDPTISNINNIIANMPPTFSNTATNKPNSPPMPNRTPTSAVSNIPKPPSNPNTPNAPNSKQPAVASSSSSSKLIVNPCQKQNKILKYIFNVAWEYGTTSDGPDYILGATTCALFLSLKYHLLYPNSMIARAKELGTKYALRVLLCMVDIDDPAPPLKEIARLCLAYNLTLILAWSHREAARYLETYKAYEHKPPDLIKPRIADDYYSQLSDCLTQIRSVNKSDVLTLASTFGSFANIADAAFEELSVCPGIGEKKVHNIFDAFRQSFKPPPKPPIPSQSFIPTTTTTTTTTSTTTITTTPPAKDANNNNNNDNDNNNNTNNSKTSPNK